MLFKTILNNIFLGHSNFFIHTELKHYSKNMKILPKKVIHKQRPEKFSNNNNVILFSIRK